MMSKLWVAGLAVSVLAVGGAGACGDDDDDTGASAQEVRVVMSDTLRFEPAEVRVKAGQPVVVVLDNSKGSALHDFTIDDIPVTGVHGEDGAEHGMGGDEAAVHMALAPGKKDEMRFVATEAGEYEYYCTVPGHAEGGMKGTLIVE